MLLAIRLETAVTKQGWIIALLLACSCRSSGVQLVNGVPTLTAAPPATLTGGPSAYALDFGVVALGQEASALLTLENVGAAALTITQTASPTDGPFTLDIGGSVSLPAGGQVQLAATFKPVSVGVRSFAVTLQTDAAKLPTLTITLSGDGEKSTLSVSPPLVSFGNVVVHTSDSLPITVTNRSPFDLTVTPGALQGTAAALFSLADGGPFTLTAGQRTQLTATYAPIVPSLSDSAQFTLTPSSGPPIEMDLQGVGVQTGLSITPATLDFSFVAPGQQPVRTVRIADIGNGPISIFSVGLDGNASGSGVFTIPSGLPAGAASTQVLTPGGELDVPVTFSPLALGYYSNNLQVTVGYAAGEVPVYVPIEGYGGGAAITCQPLALDFGPVEVGVSTTLPLICTNTGVDVPGSPEAGLEVLGLPTSSTAFSADFQMAPQPLPAGHSVLIDVNYLPLAAEADTGTLTVMSNVQNGTPPPIIQLAGSAVALGPCNYTLAPAALDWGPVPANTPATLGFIVTDLGPSDCLVWNVRLSADTSTAFSLAAPAMGAQRLSPPGGANPTSMTVPVTFEARTENAGAYGGEATFEISNPAAPNQFIPLTAIEATSCLTLQPTTLEFGTVDACDGGPCSTWPRSVVALNGCQSDVHLTAITAQVPFAPYQLPALPLDIAAGQTSPPLAFSFAPTTFGSFYASATIESDLVPGSISLFLHGAARNVTPLVPQYSTNRYLVMASGDLDGDGMLDLVAGRVGGCGLDGLDIFRGLPDGGLGAPTHLAGSSGEGIALGDLNGDGLPDIVAANWQSTNVFLQQSDGGYAAPVAYAAVGEVRTIGLGDINGDGLLDLVTQEFVDEDVGPSVVEVRLNAGGGHFGLGTTLPLGPGNGDPWSGLAVADFNQDGLADIAVGADPEGPDVWWGSSLDAPRLVIYLSEGDGGFAIGSVPITDGLVQIYILPVASRPPDLALLTNGAGVQILNNSGEGMFSIGDFYGTPYGVPGWIAMGDFNSDGVADLAVSGLTGNAPIFFVDGGISILYGISDGGFKAAETPPVLVNLVGSDLAALGTVTQPHAFAIALFEIDGGTDCAEGGIAIYGDSSRH